MRKNNGEVDKDYKGGGFVDVKEVEKEQHQYGLNLNLTEKYMLNKK